MNDTFNLKEKIYIDYHDKILGFLYYKIGHQQEAEDLTSTVFLKIYNKIDTYDQEKAALSTWVYTIARNTLNDYFRTRRVFSELGEDLTAGNAVDDNLLTNETLEELSCALESLTSRERDIIIMHYYKDLTLKQISQIMNLGYSNTKFLHQKALSELERIMDSKK